MVHVLSGQENKVRENIVKRVKTEEMGDVVYDVLLPTERVSEIKKGKKTETTRKFFPGYLIVNMHLLDENNQLVGRTWYFIRNTSGVIGFAGTKDKPIPMRQSEVESMLAQMKEREEKVKPKVSFEAIRNQRSQSAAPRSLGSKPPLFSKASLLMMQAPIKTGLRTAIRRKSGPRSRMRKPDSGSRWPVVY